VTPSITDRYELLGGTVSYRDLAHGAAPWLQSPLVRTEAARARLRAWAEGGGMSRPTPTAREIRERLVYIGMDRADRSIADTVVEVLLRIAPPARDAVLSECWIIGLGVAGLCATAPATAPGALRIIALNGQALDDGLPTTVAHECAHHWLLPLRAPTKPVTLEAARSAREVFVGLAAEWKMLDRVLAPELRDEWQAVALTRAWGFTGPGAEGEPQAAGVHARVASEASAARAALRARSDL